MEATGVIWLGMLVTVVLGISAAGWIAALFAVGLVVLFAFAWVTK